MFTENDKIGAIVAEFSMAADIFKKYHIDFCCGGDRPLGAALGEQKLGEEVLEELNAAYERQKEPGAKKGGNWSQITLSDLIDHIVNTHHRYLDKNLPVISELTFKILRVHGIGHQELYQVHKLFNALRTELEQHLITEEATVFPLIKQYEKSPDSLAGDKVKKYLESLEHEHETAGSVLKELRRVTGGFVTPMDACTSYRLTYSMLEKLESDIFQHIHLENNILHPRLRASIES